MPGVRRAQRNAPGLAANAHTGILMDVSFDNGDFDRVIANVVNDRQDGVDTLPMARDCD